MIYHGNEKENHRGSHVKYYHGGKWREGTLLEPVNYQIVVTKENPLAVLSTHTYVIPTKCITEVESVEITDVDDITQEEE